MSAVAARLSLDASTLRGLVSRVLSAAGAPEEVAESVAQSLVTSDLRGVDSHGFLRVPEYVEYMRDGRIDPAARPIVTVEGPVVRVDGRRAFGQLAAREATLAAITCAREHGVALAILQAVKHVGRVGEFVELCAEEGCVGLAFCNGGPPGGLVAPFGGRRRALGTNPLAYAFPVAERPAVVADFSTAMAAEGKVRRYQQAHDPLPDGWIVDAEGRPSTDPSDLYAGGAILPVGGHKGFALGLLCEVLGGALAGEGFACAGDDPGNGFVLLVVDAGDAFPAAAARAVASIEAVQPADGFDGVLVPGSPELESERLRSADGIPFSAETWREFAATARAVGVEVPQLEQEDHGDV